MDTEEDSTSTQPVPEHLNDLQNYLVTFNKEIEPGEQTETFSVVGAGDVDKSSTVYISQLAVPVDEQQSVPPTELVGGFVKPTTDAEVVGLGEDGVDMRDDVDPDEEPVSSLEKHDLHDVSLSDVHAQMAQLQAAVDEQDPKLAQAQLQSPEKSQFIKIEIPTSGGESEDVEQKIVHVVSIDGREHMQLVDTGAGGLVPSNGQLIHIPGAGTSGLAEVDIDQDIQDAAVSRAVDGNDQVAVLASVASNTTSVNQLQTMSVGQTEMTGAQLVAIQNSADSSQPQLVAVQEQGTMEVVGSTEAVDGASNSIVLNTGGNNFQTVTIVPSEVNPSGEMSYVLIVSQPEKDGDASPKQVALDMSAMYDMKEDCREVLEEIIDEDGTTRRVVKMTPKKFALQNQETQLMCNFCNYTSPKRYLLMRHMKSHSEDRPHKCNICERGFKTMASLQNHVNTHTGTRPHRCKECDSCFTTSGELVRHIRYKHTFEKPHKCTECDYASVELSKLKRHMRSHTGERPYHCPHCNYASPDTYKLKRHMRIHTGEKPYECDVCHARFTQSNSLKAHKLIHSGNKPVFQCDLCPTTCGRKTDLKIHMQKLHNSEKPLCCRKCSSEFPDRYTYKLHMKSHEGEKCFKCEQCDYAAQSVRHLESHMLTHTGEKPFECEECDQTFRQKQLLRRHKHLYHGAVFSFEDSREKLFECEECDKSFTHKGNLMRHMQSHVPEGEGASPPGGHGGHRSKSAETMTTPLTAEQLIQGSLLTEMREGKLGNTPKIVIVHPDGRVEEVTSKLQSLAQEKAVEELVLNITRNVDSDTESNDIQIKQTDDAQPSSSRGTSLLHHSNQEMGDLESDDEAQAGDSLQQLQGHNDGNVEEHKDVETQVALESDCSRDSAEMNQARSQEDELAGSIQIIPLQAASEEDANVNLDEIGDRQGARKRKIQDDSLQRKRFCEEKTEES